MKYKQVTDGTSHTSAFAEVLKAPGEDIRGCLHWGGGCLYLHSEPPNSHYSDLARYCAVGTNDPAAPCDLISSPPWQGAHKLCARSAHPSGINFVMLDGSTHFTSNDVDSIPHGKDTPGVWQAFSTYSGSETLSSAGGF